MKLAQILARDLATWPPGAKYITQSYTGRLSCHASLYGLASGAQALGLFEVAEDHAAAWITREAWEQAKASGISPIAVEDAPIGTRAPAPGGAYCRVARGWKWNGPDGNGRTYQRPGEDWDGRLIPPPAEHG